jgi:hypothetical protein
MKNLIFDTEGASGVFRPWEPGFYLTCFTYRWLVDGVAGELHNLWYCHKDVEPVPWEALRAQIQELIAEADRLVAHNLKHDMNVLRWMGVDFENKSLWCTMLTEYLLEGQNGSLSWGLDEVTERRGFGQKDHTVAKLWDAGVDTFDIPFETLDNYAKRDVEITGLIYAAQEIEVQEKGMEALVAVQNEFTLSLSDMEINGESPPDWLRRALAGALSTSRFRRLPARPLPQQ